MRYRNSSGGYQTGNKVPRMKIKFPERVSLHGRVEELCYVLQSNALIAYRDRYNFLQLLSLRYVTVMIGLSCRINDVIQRDATCFYRKTINSGPSTWTRSCQLSAQNFSHLLSIRRYLRHSHIETDTIRSTIRGYILARGMCVLEISSLIHPAIRREPWPSRRIRDVSRATDNRKIFAAMHSPIFFSSRPNYAK